MKRVLMMSFSEKARRGIFFWICFISHLYCRYLRRQQYSGWISTTYRCWRGCWWQIKQGLLLPLKCLQKKFEKILLLSCTSDLLMCIFAIGFLGLYFWRWDVNILPSFFNTQTVVRPVRRRASFPALLRWVQETLWFAEIFRFRGGPRCRVFW